MLQMNPVRGPLQSPGSRSAPWVGSRGKQDEAWKGKTTFRSDTSSSAVAGEARVFADASRLSFGATVRTRY